MAATQERTPDRGCEMDPPATRLRKLRGSLESTSTKRFEFRRKYVCMACDGCWHGPAVPSPLLPDLLTVLYLRQLSFLRVKLPGSHGSKWGNEESSPRSERELLFLICENGALTEHIYAKRRRLAVLLRFLLSRAICFIALFNGSRMPCFVPLLWNTWIEKDNSQENVPCG